MTDLRAAAQQALQALLDDPNKLVQISEHHWESKRDLAVIALRAALAEPVLEPVATMTVRDDMGADFKFNRAHTLQAGQEFHLYTSPLQRPAETVEEPFGWVTVRRLSRRFENHTDQYQFYPAGQSPYLDNVDECHTVYTAPPQRKPLTRPQINQMMADAGWQNSAIRQADLDKVEKVVRAVEAAHGIGSKT